MNPPASPASENRPFSLNGVSHIPPKIGSAHTDEAESLNGKSVAVTWVLAQKMRAPVYGASVGPRRPRLSTDGSRRLYAMHASEIIRLMVVLKRAPDGVVILSKPSLIQVMSVNASNRS